MSKIFETQFERGSYISRQGDVCTPTAVTFKRTEKGLVGLFNGTTSKIDCGTPDTLVGDITCVAWIKPYSWGGANGGRVLDNGKLDFMVNNSTTTKAFTISSDSVIAVHSANNSILLHKWQFVVTTRTLAGVANIYINGVLSGAANQNSGAPVANTTNLIMGDRNEGARAFDGLINDLRIYDGLLSAAEVSQLFSNERAKYNV